MKSVENSERKLYKPNKMSKTVRREAWEKEGRGKVTIIEEQERRAKVLIYKKNTNENDRK